MKIITLYECKTGVKFRTLEEAIKYEEENDCLEIIKSFLKEGKIDYQKTNSKNNLFNYLYKNSFSLYLKLKDYYEKK